MKLARDITPEDKADYLELLRGGENPGGAARQLGSTGSAFRAHRGPHTQWYDPDFAKACDEAMSAPAQEARVERLDEQLWLAVDKGEKWAVERALIAYHPDFEHLRHANIRVTGGIEHRHILDRLLNMSTEDLQAELEAAERREAVEGGNVRLLPPPADA